jgi:3-methyl-2-oxobutanoate hydroxymethyltransferase
MVINDIAGLFEGFTPKFVRRYDDLGKRLTDVAAAFVKDVKSGDFPNADESY